MTTAGQDPLRGEAPAEVVLAAAPLYRVVAQVRFPPILRISDPSGSTIANFQGRIAKEYPSLVMDQETLLHFNVGPDALPTAPIPVNVPVWRFHDRGKKWRASLSRDFLALEVMGGYSGRDDFTARWRRLLEAVEAEFGPAEVVRVGVRYLNVLSEKYLPQLTSLIRNEFTAPGLQNVGEDLKQSINMAVYGVEEGILLLRWGVLPPSGSHDPSMLEAQPERRWFLDIDVHIEQSQAFEPVATSKVIEALAKRAYAVFRWVTTPSFLEEFRHAR